MEKQLQTTSEKRCNVVVDTTLEIGLSNGCCSQSPKRDFFLDLFENDLVEKRRAKQKPGNLVVKENASSVFPSENVHYFSFGNFVVI